MYLLFHMTCYALNTIDHNVTQSSALLSPPLPPPHTAYMTPLQLCLPPHLKSEAAKLAGCPGRLGPILGSAHPLLQSYTSKKKGAEMCQHGPAAFRRLWPKERETMT